MHRSNRERRVDQQWSLEDIKGAAGAIFIAGTDTVSLDTYLTFQPPCSQQ